MTPADETRTDELRATAARELAAAQRRNATAAELRARAAAWLAHADDLDLIAEAHRKIAADATGEALVLRGIPDTPADLLAECYRRRPT